MSFFNINFAQEKLVEDGLQIGKLNNYIEDIQNNKATDCGLQPYRLFFPVFNSNYEKYKLVV